MESGLTEVYCTSIYSQRPPIAQFGASEGVLAPTGNQWANPLFAVWLLMFKQLVQWRSQPKTLGERGPPVYTYLV